MDSKLLVIIVAYNAMRWLDKCIGSVLSSSVQSDIILIDNGSTDSTQDYVKEHFPMVLFKQSTENLGFGKANNIGLQYALDNGYDYVYLLNQDAWVMPDTFEKLIKAHLNNPRFGILSPLQLQANMHHLDTNFNILCGKCAGLLDDVVLGELRDVYEVLPIGHYIMDFLMELYHKQWLCMTEKIEPYRKNIKYIENTLGT